MKLSLILEEYQTQKKIIGTTVVNEKSVIKHIQNCGCFVKKLKHFVFENNFQDQKEEIYFYKIVNPAIVGDFIYYNKILKYYEHFPFSSLRDQKKYLKNAQSEIKFHRIEVLNLYRYYLNNHSKYDNIYFIRNEQLDLFHNDPVSTFEPDFFTYYSYKFCQIQAYLKLLVFFKSEIQQIKSERLSKKEGLFSTKLSWTATKTDLVELIYSLKISGAINAGNATVKDMVDLFSQIFQVDIGSHYKIYSEIKNRAGNRSKFTHSLTKSFNEKLDRDDGI